MTIDELRARARRRLEHATLQNLGFARAIDLVGGFEAWVAAGLPVLREAARSEAHGGGRAASAAA